MEAGQAAAAAETADAGRQATETPACSGYTPWPVFGGNHRGYSAVNGDCASGVWVSGRYPSVLLVWCGVSTRNE